MAAPEALVANLDAAFRDFTAEEALDAVKELDLAAWERLASLTQLQISAAAAQRLVITTYERRVAAQKGSVQ